MDSPKSRLFRIGGMTCINCQNRIEGALKKTAGVEDAVVSFSAGTAVVTYRAGAVDLGGIKAAIEALGYRVLDGKAGNPVMEAAGTLVIILALYLLLRGLGISAFASAFPLAEAGMGYGMLFVIGLITSVHCAAMCGGINLSQCLPLPPKDAGPSPGAGKKQGWGLLFPAVLYNGGRLISYIVVGAAAGALGSVISLSGRFQGLIQLAAGAFMVIMGLNMLGIFPVLRRLKLRLPGIFTRKIGEQRAAARNPLFIGLLNGFMPCGPLQTMQVYALSTGNPIAGGLSMFLFCMGTVPLMFGIGALSSVLGNTAKGPGFRRAVTQAGAILITVMGMTMFGYGFNLSGFNFDPAGKALAALNPFAAVRGRGAAAVENIPPVENGVQIVDSTLSGGGYPAITVQQGIPVKWTINAPAGSINGCNNRMSIREYGIEHRFTPGENIIEFTPARAGRFPYSCWMGMIRSSIAVVEEGQSPPESGISGEPSPGPVPAGVTIAADSVALAAIQKEGFQTAAIRLRDDGIEPAVLVMQRGIPAVWTLVNDSLDPGNSRLIFPAYYTQIDMRQGNNVIQLTPAEDFDFSTADNVFYGYVKVVDDLSAVDSEAIEAIKEEVKNFETFIYPGEYFEAQAPGCCGRGGGA
ncbi:MAG: sulfite exporter TauE/SafE family protein [Treponema sp.]|jgi:sulfite exporter TauE/SafE/copper chaperone CopZ/plastocyanin domain-containing protein|nr:sulfite exporter TauE/SafE family protein [Treponema sp.]